MLSWTAVALSTLCLRCGRYCRQVGKAEHLNASQNQEVQQFIDAVSQTPCVQYVHQLLVAKVGQGPQLCQKGLPQSICCHTSQILSLLVVASALQLQPGDSIHALCSNLQNKTHTLLNSSCIRCGSVLTPEKCAMTHLALSMCLLAKPGMGKSWACITGSNSVIKSKSTGWTTKATFSHESMGRLLCHLLLLDCELTQKCLRCVTAVHRQNVDFASTRSSIVTCMTRCA